MVPPTDSVIAVLLAAGQSRRFGLDKRLLPLPSGRSLLQEALLSIQPCYQQILLVHRPEDSAGGVLLTQLANWQRIPEHTNTVSITPLPANPVCPASLGNSIATAATYLLAHAPKTCHSLALYLADMPSIGLVIQQQLVHQAHPDKIVRPVYDASTTQQANELQMPKSARRLGHPVILGRQFWPALQGLQGEKGGKAVWQQNPDAQQLIVTDDVSVCTDMDTVEQYHAYCQRWVNSN